MRRDDVRRPTRLLVTCEHGGNRIPARYRALFAECAEVLASHAGYDVGALAVARDLTRAFADRLRARSIFSTTSRLLVDLNRSLGHPRLHAEVVKALGPDERAAVVARYYAPYRADVERAIEAALGAGARVVHLSCHSFTPVLDDRVREVDIGLLFDPARPWEGDLARRWRAAIQEGNPALRVRFNQPYRGTSDGLTTAMRRAYPGRAYAGLELEVNQRYPTGDAAQWRGLRQLIVATFGVAVGADPSGPARRTAVPRAWKGGRAMFQRASSE